MTSPARVASRYLSGSFVGDEVSFDPGAGGAGVTRYVVEEISPRGVLRVRRHHPRHGTSRKLDVMTKRQWEELKREAEENNKFLRDMRR